MDRLRTLRSLTALLAVSVALAACGGSRSGVVPAAGQSAGIAGRASRCSR